MESALGPAVSIINAMSAQGVWGFASQQSSEKARYWGSQTLTHSALSHPKGHKKSQLATGTPVQRKSKAGATSPEKEGSGQPPRENDRGDRNVFVSSPLPSSQPS